MSPEIRYQPDLRHESSVLVLAQGWRPSGPTASPRCSSCERRHRSTAASCGWTHSGRPNLHSLCCPLPWPRGVRPVCAFDSLLSTILPRGDPHDPSEYLAEGTVGFVSDRGRNRRELHRTALPHHARGPHHPPLREVLKGVSPTSARNRAANTERDIDTLRARVDTVHPCPGWRCMSRKASPTCASPSARSQLELPFNTDDWMRLRMA